MPLILKNYSKTHFRVLPADEESFNEYKNLYYKMKRKVDGHQFMNAYKFGDWDGSIDFLHYKTGLVKLGLLGKTLSLIQEGGVQLKGIDKALYDDNFIGFPKEQIWEWLKRQKVYSKGKELTPRQYQLESVVEALNSKRILVVSPTSSGKSLIIYLILKFLLEQVENRVLIIVPTKNLVTQLFNDFCDYENVTQINWAETSTDKKRQNDKKVFISTWQTVIRIKDPEFWREFDGFFVDEAHHCKATSLNKINDNLRFAEWRFGFSGSIRKDWKNTDFWNIMSQFGKIHTTTTTKELIDTEQIAKAQVILYELDHTIKYCPKLQYKDELKYICSMPERNDFIERLVRNAAGNVLVLFSLVEKQGKPLYEQLKAAFPERAVLFVYGAVDAQTREQIRQYAEENKDVVIVASYQTFSTGVNIKNLHNVIFASPTKSFVRVVQSIGRGLRKAENKTDCTIYDIFDLLYGRPDKNVRGTNYTYRHFLNRLQIYKQEQFPTIMKREVIIQKDVDK